MSGARQLDLRDYGAIGNLRTVALVGRDGAIAWCCLPELDRPAVFASLLDGERGGEFRVSPENCGYGESAYLEGSNVLTTRFQTGDTEVVVTDFLPLRRRNGELLADGNQIHRLLVCRQGEARISVRFAPRFDYARARTGIGRREDAWLASGCGASLWLCGLPADTETQIVEDDDGNATLLAHFSLRAGTPVALVLAYGNGPERVTTADTQGKLRRTVAAWRHWCRRGKPPTWAGRHASLVQRSTLALKLLCNAETGAIAAAATTSVPEAIGGERNWDYRYAWLRDAGMTAEALLGAGHAKEVHDFLAFIERVERRGNPHGPWLQLVFGLHGETELPQVELPHLAGYRGSRPVRIGNHIVAHRGHDIYEQVLGAALEYLALGRELPGELMRFFGRVADIAAREWRHPDHGIWELPDGPRHYVHSKWTASVALDHAIRLAREHGIEGDVAAWRRERDACRAEVLEKGWDARRARFRMAYDVEALDSANVLMPQLGFLPADDPRVIANLKATMEGLVVDDLCYRYRIDDGLQGEEGCFVACTFWIVEALVLAGDLRKARWLFDHAASRCGPLGLWTEQIDVRTGLHLGNLPQAFSHVAFHDAALRLAQAEGKRVPVDPDPAHIGAPARNPPLQDHGASP